MTTETTKKRRRITGPSGPLYDLLIERLPDFRTMYGGHVRLDVYKLAESIGTSHQVLYEMLPKGDKPAGKNLSLLMARRFIKLSETQEGVKPLTLLDLEPFLPS